MDWVLYHNKTHNLRSPIGDFVISEKDNVFKISLDKEHLQDEFTLQEAKDYVEIYLIEFARYIINFTKDK